MTRFTFSPALFLAFLCVNLLARPMNSFGEENSKEYEDRVYQEGGWSKKLRIYLPGKKVKRIKLKNRAILINDETRGPNNISVNYSGDKIVWSGGPFQNVRYYSEINRGSWSSVKISKGKFLKVKGPEYRDFRRIRLPVYTGVSFGEGRHIDPQGNPEVLTVDAHSINLRHGAIYFFRPHNRRPHYFEIFKTLDKNDFKLKGKKIPLKHSRISPNGKWLTFYTRGVKGQEGCYLYHFKTKRTIHLGAFDDKHCTWSPSGDKIFFHHQVGGNSSTKSPHKFELSYIGYYQLHFNRGRNGNKVWAQRVLLDNVNLKKYTYFKHPTQIPGTNLVLFHGRLHPERGGMKIFVKHLKRAKGLYRLVVQLKDSKGDKVKLKVKHPSLSGDGKSLFFIGTEKGKAKGKIYLIREDGLKKIQNRARPEQSFFSFF